MEQLLVAWDKELIHKIVDEGTTKRILSIPISGANTNDMVVWKYEGSGEYTVKSAYPVLSTEVLQNHSSTSPNTDGYRDFYKSLWSLNIPAKIKIHIWRLINNLLPHFCNLARRSLRVDVVCSLCKVDQEDSGHLMWSCDILQSVWASFQVKLLTDVGDACLAQARACMRALLFADMRGFRRLIIEGDSLTVIKSIQKKEKDKSILRPITSQINFLEANFDHVTYTFVPRFGNRTAHTLAMEGRRRQVFGVWADGVPGSVEEMAMMDRQRHHGSF